MRVPIIGGIKAPHNDFLKKKPPAPAVDTPAPPRTIPHCTTPGCTAFNEPMVPHVFNPWQDPEQQPPEHPPAMYERCLSWRCLDCDITQAWTHSAPFAKYCHKCHREQLDARDMSGSTSHLCVTCEDADTQIEHDRMRMGW